MPYIKDEQKDKALLDPTDAGELNYAITSMVDDYILAKGDRYVTYNEVIGVLECAKQELYRRIIAPYEDRKCAENGDVYATRTDEH